MPTLKISQSSAVSAFTVVLGNIIALVPSWAPEKAHILQIGTFVIAGVFLIANSIHYLADKHATPDDVKAEAISYAQKAAKDVLDSVNIPELVDSVIDSKDPVGAAVTAARAEVQRAFAGLQNLSAGAAGGGAVTQIPVTPASPPVGPSNP